MNSARCLLSLTILAASCSAVPPRAVPAAAPGPSSRTVRVGVAEGVRRVALEDYVRAAVISELAPSGEPAVVERMLEVQAVIARTYALANLGRHARDGFDLCSTTHCQLYEPARLGTSRWAAAAAAAARRTAGVVLWHDGVPVAAMFHADCGGHTSTSVSAWGGSARPYLQAVPDDGPAAAAHAHWSYTATGAAIVAALNTDARTRVGSRLDTIRVVDRDDSGRAATVALHGARERLVKGEDLRAVLSRQLGARAVRSTLFDIRRTGAGFTFEGRGFGHGVGLCQAGARARLGAGATVADVLRHYYPGTSLRPAS